MNSEWQYSLEKTDVYLLEIITELHIKYLSRGTITGSLLLVRSLHARERKICKESSVVIFNNAAFSY